MKYVNRNKNWFAGKDVLSPYKHELGHRIYYKKIQNIENKYNIDYNKAKDMIDARIYDYIHKRNETNAFFIHDKISGYAHESYLKHKYTEIIAECNAINENEVASEILDLIK